jgi:hypothetical protein
MPALDSQTVHDVLLPSTYGPSSLSIVSVSVFAKVSQNGLQRYQTRIYIAMGLIITTFMVVIMTIYLSCRPFPHYWQINPDPGTVCQAAVSKPILWVSFVSNVSTDMFLLLIPVPMLWKSSLKTAKKIAATMVLSAGVLVIICAVLKSIHVIVVSFSITVIQPQQKLIFFRTLSTADSWQPRGAHERHSLR